MSFIKIIKAPIEDIKHFSDVVNDIKADHAAFERGDLNKLSFNRKKQENKLNLTKAGFPLLISAILAGTFGVTEVFESFNSGVPFSELLSSNLDFISNSYNQAFPDNDLLSKLNVSSMDTIKDYVDYIVSGTKDFFSKIGSEYVNPHYLLAVTSVYATSKAIMKSFDLLSGYTPNMIKYRDYETENLKLNILRKHYQDPVFDNLNNEEMFAMMISFNDLIHQNKLGKKNAVSKAIRFIDKTFNVLLKPFRKTINSSTNDKNHLINNVFDYLENDIDPDNLQHTYKKYGIESRNLKILAANDSGVNDKDIYNYIFKTNKKAMVNAYKRKLKDDTMLSFAITLENFVKGNIQMDDNFKSQLEDFKTFISGYKKNKKHLGRLSIPNDLKEMNNIIETLCKNNEASITSIKRTEKFKDYTNFIKQNAPHLIEEVDDYNININNYSFLTYYEAEKERIVKHDYYSTKLLEHEEALSIADESRNLGEYEKQLEKIKIIKEKKSQYEDIFAKERISNNFKKGDDILKADKKTISSIYKDNEINKKVHVVNFLKNKEDVLNEGRSVKEKGVCLEDALRAAEYKLSADLRASDYNPDISRLDFKNQEKKFRN